MDAIKTYVKAIVVALVVGVSVATFLGLSAANTHTFVKAVAGIFA